jgi:Predicted nucleic-acid-binding protein, contains PIN domain
VAAPFLDTNVLVYAFSSDHRSGLANTFLLSPFIVGVQTLNELANVLSRRGETMGRNRQEQHGGYEPG